MNRVWPGAVGHYGSVRAESAHTSGSNLVVINLRRVLDELVE